LHEAARPRHETGERGGQNNKEAESAPDNDRKGQNQRGLAQCLQQVRAGSKYLRTAQGLLIISEPWANGQANGV
jgi:hypothetical protein